MVAVKAIRPTISCSSSGFESGPSVPLPKVGFVKMPSPSPSLGLNGGNNARLSLVQPTEESTVAITNDRATVISGENIRQMATNGKATNIVWHKSSVGKLHRQELLQQKGCVIWITGLSGSGKSTLACALCQALYSRGKLTYILDGDNVRHGLNRDLSFKAEDRVENIRRIGEVAKLFADAGIICIASVISPYRRDRDACRALLPEGDFIELELPQKGNNCASPCEMAEIVISYLEEKGYLHA
ncbi:hypothetical protein CRYUN_Cryun24cG0052900 [Craigia yunnanensis]